MAQDDPVAAALRKQPLTDAQRADLWDAFESSTDADDLAAKLETLKAPQAIKADLWDLKEQTSGAAQPEPVADFKTKTVADPSLLQTLGEGYINANIGALKGVGQTVANVARLPYAIPGVQAGVERLYGFEPGTADRMFERIDQALQPDGTVQRVTKAGEQIAETILPGGLVSKAGVALAAKAPAGVKLATRALVEAGGAAGIAGVQRTDPTSAAVVGGAIPVVGAALSAGGRALRSSNPVIREAVEFAQRRNIPVDAATATDHGLVRATQHVVDRSLGGSVISHGAREAQTDAMQRVARELASEAHPEAVVPEQAGQAIREGVKARIKEFYQEANSAYRALREIEARPENVRLVPRTPKEAATTIAEEAAKEGAEEVIDTAMFRPSSRRPADLWAAVLQDAKEHGYTGSTQQLRKAFDDKMADAMSLVDEMNASNTGRNFLRFLADNGGIGKAEGDLQGEVDRLWEMSGAARRMDGILKKRGGVKKQQFNASGEIGGVPGVVRKGGLTADQMVERLRADPEFGPTFADAPDSMLFDVIEEMARTADSIKVGPVEALAQTGVRPGQKWWQVPKPPAEPEFDEMALPVDMRPVKDGLRGLYDQMRRQMPVFQQQASPGLKALQNIVEGPDFSPASVADADLGAIKKLARGAEMPELRSIGQGTAAEAVRHLEDAVQAAVASAGPDAIAARNTGRAYTISKAQAADVLKAIRKEPVQAFNQVTFANDAGVEQLRKVAELAPQEMPKVGRAYLEKLFGQATEEGGFGRAQSLFRSWQNLGDETKKILYPNPMLRRDLDAFFQLAKKAAENPNPSGTWHMAVQGGQWVYLATEPVTGASLQIGAAALSKLLHSPKGVRLLTEGMQLKQRSGATAGSIFAQLQKLALQAESVSPAVLPGRPAESRTGAAR